MNQRMVRPGMIERRPLSNASSDSRTTCSAEISPGTLRLRSSGYAGDLLPLGRDRPGVDRHHVHAGAAKLGVQGVGEVEGECLRGGVDRLVRDRLHPGGGGDVDDAAASPLEHLRQERVAEGDDRLAVEPDLLGVARRVVLEERAGGAEAGVVDEQADVDAELLDLSGSEPAPSARSQATTWASVGSSAGELLQAVGAAGDKDDVVAPRGELARELFANSRGCAGDEGCFGHGLTLFSFGGVNRSVSSRAAVPRQVAGGSCPLLGGASTCGSWATPSYPAVRREPEPDSAMRTPFQRDRDRIVHSKAFRRLKHKTQVFIAPEGDHYRTRLTHTIETCGIARTVARALGLNEDLAEAIGLGPRPRASAVRAHRRGGARRGAAGEGGAELPPQPAVAAGRRRAGARRARAQPHRAGARRDPQPHRVGAADRRSRGGSCGSSTGSRTSTTTSTTRCGRGSSPPDDLPAAEIELLGPTGAQRIDTLAQDIVERVAQGGGHRPERGDRARRCCVLRKFMFERVYLGEEARSEHERVQRTVRGLFDHYVEHPDEVPEGADGRRRDPADHRLHRRDDRPVLHRGLQADRAARGVAGSEQVHARDGRAGQGRRRHRRDRLRLHGPAAGGRAVTRGCARSTRSARRRSRSTRGRSSTTASGARRAGDVFRFVQEKEGLGLPGGGRGARRALRGRDRARERGPARRGGAASGGRGSASCSSGRRSSTPPTCGSRRRRRRRGSTWSRGGSARRCCGRSASGTRRAPGTRC